VVAGHTDAQIAEELFIASATFARHISKISGKTGLTGRAELVSWAIEQGFDEN